MSVFLDWRIAIAVATGITRIVQVSSGPGARSEVSIPRWLWTRLNDHSEFPGDLSAALTTSLGYPATVDDISGDFELRLCQVHWGRESGAAGGADDAITTHHFVKLVSGAPSPDWVDANYVSLETALTAFWTEMKDDAGPHQLLKAFRWYKAGPAIVPPNPPVRVTTVSLPGTAGAAAQAPPQCAVTVTELTSDPKSWGRFYLPVGLAVTWLDNFGRIGTGRLSELGTAAENLYEAAVTASLPSVVYSAAKEARLTAAGKRAGATIGDPGVTLPAVAARALAVAKIQIDDIPDVIRSRRWNEPLAREIRTIAGA